MARMLFSRPAAGLALLASLLATMIAPPGAQAKVYFSAFLAEGGIGIERSGFDGAEPETLELQTTGFDDGIAVDVRDGAMYWTDTSASIIWRANLNGTEAQIVADDFGWEPLGVALDPAGGKLYWNDRQGVKRANLDGAGQELLTKGAAGGFITLDLEAHRMYWISGGTIRSATMEPNPTVNEVVKGQSAPFGLAVDHAGGKLYWLELSPRNEIRRANLDGSEIQTLLERPEAGLEGGLAIDPVAGKLYWTEAGAHDIGVANLDGSQARTLFSTGKDSPEGLAIETGNPHPTNTLAPVIEGRAQVGNALSCNPGAWSGTGPISFTYRWLLGGANTIEGVAGPLYTAPIEQAGSMLACQVIATDEIATSTATSPAVSLGALPGEPATTPGARLIAGIAVARITSSGSRARIPVFTSLACRATLTARPIARRRRPRAYVALRPHRRRPGRSRVRTRKPPPHTISVGGACRRGARRSPSRASCRAPPIA